ncbi:hypothetical protein GN244_ATG16140 [Phytophthora infestans]|uniref:Uncharacterized protein n=1 Tax=Phytophthora infestans TaxID=4787 RepID=A0A833W7P2_PHYIN|nr:hypothetical protein GN244_ATG16140 [Phytophthora infestans]
MSLRFGKRDRLLEATSAKLIDSTKVRVYLLSRKTPVDVLNQLKLGDDVATWSSGKYIALLNKETPGKTSTLIGTLTAHYGNDAVVETLISAESSVDSSSALKKLTQQLRSLQQDAWLESGKSADYVFKLLKLGGDGYKALIDQSMFVLSEYVSKFNHLHPRRKSTVLKTSTKGFGGESNLVTLLDTAKRDALTEVKAMEFETQLLQQWQDENLDPASAMKLRLDSNAYNILKSPNLRTLKKYFNENNPAKQKSLLDMLTSKYGEANVAQTLADALHSQNTAKDVATATRWVGGARFVCGKCSPLRSNMFLATNPSLETLEDYIVALNSHHKTDETVSANLMLMEARTSGKLRLETPATKLQNAQFRERIDNDIDPKNVLTSVFNVEEADALRNQIRVVRAYEAYFKKKNNAAPHKVDPRRS